MKTSPKAGGSGEKVLHEDEQRFQDPKFYFPPWARSPVSIEVRLSTPATTPRLMMSEFAVAPARLIDNSGRRAIGIALPPQHFKGDALGMNRCHGRHIGAPGEAMEELDSPYRGCASV
ncbi:hypothetical protein THAOC_31525 [Thalassiosira oceanica]|uniref:DUF6820 domain-containing protein n=1 Tax=Thalassiosira oceanica TaxID=159749 RepID=K0RBA6_THAOC|nr:hypothetical protein THAOC_31525 [Thalassiosira oceanica]|eukprot:EJK49584.1 hypothetical protein THAOC_31525 [Thalassiosira oceanica]